MAARSYEEDVILDVFRRFDTTGDGLIDKDELAQVFREVDPEHWDENRIEGIMRACDNNGDGRIDYEEFVAWLMFGAAEWNDAKDMAFLRGEHRPSATLAGFNSGEKKGKKDKPARSRSAHVRDTRGTEAASAFIEMTVETTKKSKLGCKLANPQTLAIKSIDPDGLFGQWNEEHGRKAQIAPGDRIIQVNHFTQPKEILKELRKIGALTIIVRPAAGTTRYQTHVDEVYNMSDIILDEGKLACVRRARHKKTDEEVVVKSVHKNNTSPETAEMAINMLKALDHPNIVKLYDVFEDYLEWHMILQYCSGGEVFEKILADTTFTEKQAARIQQQIFSALAYMHRKGFSHRDLKPENLLLERETDLEQCVIKIIDWHSARPFGPSTKFKTLVGTPEFTAPEIVKGLRYTYTCDLWSAGVLMYFMIAGYPPFNGESAGEIYAEVRRANFSFPDEEFSHISSEAKDLICKLLQMDPQGRISAEDSMKHDWVRTFGTVLIERSVIQEQGKMRDYVNFSKFKKQALLVFSRHLSSEKLQMLKSGFDLLDSNGDGMITYVELKAGLEKLGELEQVGDFKALFESMDANGTKRIEFSEFMAATMDARHFKEEASLWSTFQVFDRDSKGHISYSDIANLLEDASVKHLLGESTVEKVLTDFDTNGDGVIDFHEFMAMIRGEDYSGTF